jgi:hypothetical protein
VGRPEYLLLTEPAHRDLKFPADTRFEAGSEQYEHLGSITTFVHYLQPEPVGKVMERSFTTRYDESLRTFLRLWFGQVSWPWRTHGNVPAQGNLLARLGLSLVTLLLTPLFIPAGALLALIQSCKSDD